MLPLGEGCRRSRKVVGAGPRRAACFALVRRVRVRHSRRKQGLRVATVEGDSVIGELFESAVRVPSERTGQSIVLRRPLNLYWVNRFVLGSPKEKNVRVS